MTVIAAAVVVCLEVIVMVEAGAVVVCLEVIVEVTVVVVVVVLSAGPYAPYCRAFK